MPTDAAGKRLGQSAITTDTPGGKPRAYLYANFQRQPPKDEQYTLADARHQLHRGNHRRLDHSMDAS